MKNKKNIFITLFIISTIWVGVFFLRTNHFEKVIGKTNQIKREIASVSIKKDDFLKKVDKKLKRTIVGDKSKNFTIANKIEKQWKKKAIKKFSQTWKSKFTIEEKKSALFVKHGIARNVEHVLFNLISKDGKPASFEAYIDSQTGKILQTWNKTRYEMRTPLKFSSHNIGFKSHNIHKQQ